MRAWIKNRKVQLAFFFSILFAGLSIFAYFTYQQQRFNNVTKEKQQIALRVMKRKNDNQALSTVNSAISDKTSAFHESQKKADYSGKDVKRLTLSQMNQVDAKKVTRSFGTGLLEIPSIGMELPILEGMSQSNLSIGAGTMKAGQELKKGNFSLAGHYMTNAGLLFGGIKCVDRGDLIKVIYRNEQAIYHVIETKRITKSDGYVIFDSQGEDLLTLVTCDQAVDGTPYRFMVRAAVVD
ncbi:MAG: class A sortase [Enterococcus sp.]